MVNKVTLIGRVGKDPEITKYDNGIVAKFSLATFKNWKDKKGEKQEQTEWHSIVAFGRTAEVIRDYVKKGDQLYVEGEIHYDSYENKEGNKVYYTEIRCQSLKMLTSKSEPKAEPKTAGPAEGIGSRPDYNPIDGGLPF